MRPRHMLCLLVCLVLSAAAAQPALANGADAVFDEMLGRYVVADADGVNRVDYARWKARTEDRAKLASYVADLQKRTPSRMGREEAIAYWSNLYNAITLNVVLDKYPVSSIRDIKSEGFFDPKAYIGPWRTKRATVEGKSYSLDEIENDVLRPIHKDPRVHYALNCASIGCPNLGTEAFVGARLNEQLEAAAKAYVNTKRGVTVEGARIVVSSIYVWYKADFGDSDLGVLNHLRRYAAPTLARQLEGISSIKDHAYDWGLNDTSR